MLHPDAIPKRSDRDPPPLPLKHLSFDPLIRTVYERARQLLDTRTRDGDYSIADAAMSAIAMFSLKDSSLLAFQERRNDHNMKNLYRIENVPSDTRMRELLDPISPSTLRPMFNDVFRQLQRGGALKPYVFHEGAYLLSIDGTQYFSSKKVHCDSCLEKRNKQTGEITYSHQMLGAVLVHPDLKQVIPLAPEPIVKQDGDCKNDCERNAAKRLLTQIREEHPHLKMIVVEDGLASNAPHIQLLKSLRMSFILGAKPDDHEYLFDQAIQAAEEDRDISISFTDPKRPGVRCEISFVANLSLNKTHPDLRVNFLQYIEYGPDGHERKKFSWVTDLTITPDNAKHLVRGGRARWKVENETFNTLKNQGYNFEHNYGHGKINLSVVLAMLMMLTFLLDQTQELRCPLFQAIRKKYSSRRAVWDHLRSHFRHFKFESMKQLYEVMLSDLAKNLPPPTYASRRLENDPEFHTLI
jgi:hypothetical protein